MTPRSPMRCSLEIGLIISVTGLAVPARADDTAASVTGSIVWSESGDPLQGARLHLGDPGTGEIYTSGLSDTDGSISLDGVPPAAYQVAVESEGGLYPVATTVELVPGQNQPLYVAVRSDYASEPTDQQNSKKKKGGIWQSPGMMALYIVGIAFLVGWAITEINDDGDSSDSSDGSPTFP